MTLRFLSLVIDEQHISVLTARPKIY